MDSVACADRDGDTHGDRIAFAGAPDAHITKAFAASDRDAGETFAAPDVHSFHAAALPHRDDGQADAHAQAGRLLRGRGVHAGRDLHADSGEEEEIAEIDRIESLRLSWRDQFRAGPSAAFRGWFRLQEELAETGEAQTARVLADDLWEAIPELRFESAEERGRFLHNLAVFFGTPGEAADLGRARRCFSEALDCFDTPDEAGWHARVLHNFASAISNLGQSADELSESVRLFERALVWRTSERAIARGVTLHNMGIVLRRLAEQDLDHAVAHLDSSADALREAASIRDAHSLSEGHALSLFHLGLTLEAGGREEEARAAFESAADEFDRLGKSDSAAIARERANSTRPG